MVFSQSVQLSKRGLCEKSRNSGVGNVQREGISIYLKKFWSTVKQVKKRKQGLAQAVPSRGGTLLPQTRDTVTLKTPEPYQHILSGGSRLEDSEEVSPIVMLKVSAVVRKLLSRRTPSKGVHVSWGLIHIEREMDGEMDKRFDAVSAVMVSELFYNIYICLSELSPKSKLPSSPSTY